MRQPTGIAKKAARHGPVVDPPVHASAMPSSTLSEQRPCSGCVTGVRTVAPHVPYDAGQVVCWLLHCRGETRPLQNEPALAQFWQATPFSPQDVLSEPSTLQVLFARQQPAQFDGPHFSTHCRDWQDSFVELQFVHAAPPPPQVASCVPVTQVFPEQQPLGHVAGPHGGSLHAPASHEPPWFWQFWQMLPALPHAVFSAPVAQKSPTQQPAQFCGPQRLDESTH